MQEEEKQIIALSNVLDPLSLGGWQYHPVVHSTNDIAQDWAEKGAADWSLVLADEQTAGRGQGSRRWHMAAGKGLAMSLILRVKPDERTIVTRFTALAALGLVHALRKYQLEGWIKWPNDVLLKGKKVGGVLVETAWVGDSVEACIIGMGVNVAKGCIPKSTVLNYPAITVEDAYGSAINRWELLAQILRSILAFRPIITTEAFIDAWNQQLMFRGKWVHFLFSTGVVKKVKLMGICADGKLQLQYEDGSLDLVNAGSIIGKSTKSG